MCTFITINSTIRYLFPVYLSLIPHGIHSYTYLQLLAMHKHCILKHIVTMKITVHLFLFKRIIFHVTVLDLIEDADILLQMPRYVDNKLCQSNLFCFYNGKWGYKWSMRDKVTHKLHEWKRFLFIYFKLDRFIISLLWSWLL